MPPLVALEAALPQGPELQRELTRQGLVPGGTTGLRPRATVFRQLRALFRRKRGVISYAAAFREMDIAESPDLSVSYIGFARKP